MLLTVWCAACVSSAAITEGRKPALAGEGVLSSLYQKLSMSHGVTMDAEMEPMDLDESYTAGGKVGDFQKSVEVMNQNLDKEKKLQLNMSDGTRWAYENMKGDKKDLSKNFYCPKEFYPSKPGGFQFETSQQACCVLDKSLALMEVIYLMRHCKKYEHGDKHWGMCWSGAVDAIYWHLRACCVDKKFFFDHSERECMARVHDGLKHVRSKLNETFYYCTGMDALSKKYKGVPVKYYCKKAERKAVPIIRQLHLAARYLYQRGWRTGDVNKQTKSFLRIAAAADDDTLANVEKFFAMNGGKGVPSDGAPCEGC